MTRSTDDLGETQPPRGSGSKIISQSTTMGNAHTMKSVFSLVILRLSLVEVLFTEPF